MNKIRFNAKIATAILMLMVMFFTSANNVNGQTVYPYQPDRPGMAAGAYSVGLHRLDYEGNVNYARYFTNTTASFNSQFRYGMFNHLEIRGGFSAQYSEYVHTWGLNNFNLGCKIPIIRDTSTFPAIAILGSAVMPNIGDKSFAVTQYLPSASLIVQKTFGASCIIGNIGLMSDSHAPDGSFFMNPNSINHKVQGTYSLAFYKYYGGLGVFMETYGFYGAGSSKPYGAFDLGATFMINENITTDVSFGASYEEGINISFFNWGLGWLIPTTNKQ